MKLSVKIKIKQYPLFIFLAAVFFFPLSPLQAHTFAPFGNVNPQGERTITVAPNVGSTQFGLVLDITRRPALCFIDRDNQNSLTLATFNGNQWVSEPIEANLESNDECQLLFDINNQIHIVYSKKRTNELKHATSLEQRWQIFLIENNLFFDFTLSRHFSIASAPSQSKIGVAYYDTRNQDLKYAQYERGAWQTGVAYGEGNAGRWPSLAFDPQGNPAIAFMKNGGANASELAYLTHDGFRWQEVEVVDRIGEAGFYNALHFDRQGTPPLAYRRRNGQEKQLLYAVRRNNNWDDKTTLGAQANNLENARFCRLTLDPRGNAYIAHNWDQASALFGRMSQIDLESIYFKMEGSTAPPTKNDRIAFYALGINRYTEIACICT